MKNSSEDATVSKDQLNEILKEAYSNSELKPEYFNVLQVNQCHDLCSSGKCNADCCGCVSILESHYKRLKKLIPEGKDYTEIRAKIDGEVYVKPITQNYKCVFLTSSNSCAIYNSHLRPSVCKRFGEDEIEPLYACVHINPELKTEIEEFSKLYLANQSVSNPLAKRILDECDEGYLDSLN